MRQKLPRIKGGVAFMIKVPESPKLEPIHQYLEEALRDHPDWTRAPRERYHVTLQFIGRDLAVPKVDAIQEATRRVVRELEGRQIPLEFTGVVVWDRSWKKNYVAMELRREALEGFRIIYQTALTTLEVKPRDSYEFNPHVTIADGPPARTPIERRNVCQPFQLESRSLVLKCGPVRHEFTWV